MLASAERERAQLEERLAALRHAVQGVEEQMDTLAGEIAAQAGAIGGLVGRTDPTGDAAPEAADHSTESPAAASIRPSALPISGFQAPDENAPLAIAEPSATIVVVDGDELGDMAAESHTSTQYRTYADPDGSGRPPAERATVVPEEATATPVPDRNGPDRTVYQRAGRNLRARLRREGQDPTQRGR